MFAETSSPFVFLALMFALAVLPFLLLSVTSFIKLSVVFGIMRNALGAQQVPSSVVVSLVSLILSFHIMTPVAREVVEEVQRAIPAKYLQGSAKAIVVHELVPAALKGAKPLERFLRKNSRLRERLFFAEFQQRQLPQGKELCSDTLPVRDCLLRSENFVSLVSAFVLSELAEAFAIGFMIFLPFLIVDLVVSNILVSLGMMMVSPLTVSLPLKLLLFVICDAWFVLSKSLVSGYHY